MNLIFLDTECTGIEKEDRLLQLAYKVEGMEYVNELFKPPLPIKHEAMAIHHVTEKMVVDKPSFVGSKRQLALADLIDKGGIVVAHNAKFDIGMIRKEGIQIPEYICTLKVARFLDPKGILASYGLQYLRYKLGIEVEATAHDALGDIKVLQALYERLYTSMCKSLGHDRGLVGSGDVIDKMVAISKQPSLIPRCAFKKHKGKLWADVAKSDPDYLRWFLKEKEGEEEKDEDLMYTLKHYLNG